MFLYQICEIFKNTHIEEHLQKTASEHNEQINEHRFFIPLSILPSPCGTITNIVKFLISFHLTNFTQKPRPNTSVEQSGLVRYFV